MNLKFNLFSLHRKCDVHPRSWICVAGDELKKLIDELEKEVETENNISRENLSKIIGEKLDCSISVIKTLLQGKKGSIQ